MTARTRLVIAGNAGVEHVGRHLLVAAAESGIDASLSDVGRAWDGPSVLRAFNWRFRGHRPPRLAAFSRALVDGCRGMAGPVNVLIATGMAPITASALIALGDLGIRRMCFLTDDPWNPTQRASWFLQALPHYDHVFTPRDTQADLSRIGCRAVSCLPFAYAPDIHFPEPPADTDERARFESDVVFVGGADPDRVAWMTPLIRAGLDVALYGGYWDRYPDTRQAARGMADPQVVRKAIGGAKVALCLVRRANRDTHSMRTFEVPAIGACMLVEDTPGHRAIFGADGEAVMYVRDPDSARDRILRLRDDAVERRRLAAAARALVTAGANTWGDRLAVMMRSGEHAR